MSIGYGHRSRNVVPAVALSACLLLLNRGTCVGSSNATFEPLLTTQPGALVESPEEQYLGRTLNEFYLERGMRLVSSPRATAVWARLLPVFKKSFSRIPFELDVFEREDPDIMSVPGHIYISTGAIERLDDGELAQVVAHEFVHMADSSRLKLLQHIRDLGSSLNNSLQEPSDIADFYRGHCLAEGLTMPVQEQTALSFGLGMAAEAGYRPMSLETAWGKLTKSMSVEFEDYVNLHGLQGSMWPIISSEIEAMGDGVTSTGEVGSIGTHWSLDAYSIYTAASLASVQEEVRPSARYGLTNGGWGFSTNAAGQVAYMPEGQAYWRIADDSGYVVATLDHRDNLFTQYSALEMSLDQTKVSLTSHQDVIVYDVRKGTSLWLGLGRLSHMSPDGAFIAYTDGDVLFVKKASTGQLVRTVRPELAGTISRIVWSPSSVWLALAEATRPDVLHIVRMADGRIRDVSLGHSLIVAPIWTAKGIISLASPGPGSLVISRSAVTQDGEIAGSLSRTIALPRLGAIASVDAIESAGKIWFAVLSRLATNRFAVSILEMSEEAGDADEVSFFELPKAIEAVGEVRWAHPGETVVVSTLTDTRGKE